MHYALPERARTRDAPRSSALSERRILGILVEMPGSS
jgi:hypothetical protein